MIGGDDFGAMLREEEERRLAEASTPEAIAADEALFARNRKRCAAELESLRRQGMIDEGGSEEDEDDDDDIDEENDQ